VCFVQICVLEIIRFYLKFVILYVPSLKLERECDGALETIIGFFLFYTGRESDDLIAMGTIWSPNTQIQKNSGSNSANGIQNVTGKSVSMVSTSLYINNFIHIQLKLFYLNIQIEFITSVVIGYNFIATCHYHIKL
jgi:hypothetical protein